MRGNTNAERAQNEEFVIGEKKTSQGIRVQCRRKFSPLFNVVVSDELQLGKFKGARFGKERRCLEAGVPEESSLFCTVTGIAEHGNYQIVQRRGTSLSKQARFHWYINIHSYESCKHAAMNRKYNVVGGSWACGNLP